MSIVCFPGEMRLQEMVICALCKKEAPSTDATLGPLSASGLQTFACNAHFRLPSDFITGWADFSARERQKLLDRGELTPTGTQMKEWEDDWTVY